MFGEAEFSANIQDKGEVRGGVCDDSIHTKEEQASQERGSEVTVNGRVVESGCGVYLHSDETVAAQHTKQDMAEKRQ